jgi:hypothetical protein
MHHPTLALSTFISQMREAADSFDFDRLTLLLRTFRKL